MAMGAVRGTAAELDMMTEIEGPAAIQVRSCYFRSGYRDLFLEIWEVTGRRLVGSIPTEGRRCNDQCTAIGL